MRLPNADEAIIAPEKLRDYLLSSQHPTGCHKSAFFAGLGYTGEDWEVLERALRDQHLASDAEEEETTEWGRMFVVTAPLIGPHGRQASVRSVWIIRREEETPRFVTAYPAV